MLRVLLACLLLFTLGIAHACPIAGSYPAAAASYGAGFTLPFAPSLSYQVPLVQQAAIAQQALVGSQQAEYREVLPATTVTTASALVSPALATVPIAPLISNYGAFGQAGYGLGGVGFGRQRFLGGTRVFSPAFGLNGFGANGFIGRGFNSGVFVGNNFGVRSRGFIGGVGVVPVAPGLVNVNVGRGLFRNRVNVQAVGGAAAVNVRAGGRARVRIR